MAMRRGIEVVSSSELGVTYILPDGSEQTLVRSLYNCTVASAAELNVATCEPYLEGMAKWNQTVQNRYPVYSHEAGMVVIVER